MVNAIVRPSAIFVIGVLPLVGHVPAFGQEVPPAGPVKWEYRVVTREQLVELGKNDLAAGLNRLGDEGWQLVTVEPAAAADKNSGVPARAAHYYFLRPRGYHRLQREAVLRRVASARSEFEMCEDRLAWSERMVKKGYITATQARADQEQLRRARAALDAAERELNILTPMPEQPRPKDK